MLYNRKILIIVLCIFSQTISSFAGLRRAGKYSGVPIFDRWDACVLYSGVYLMYVSKKVKESLRPYAGKSILIDAKQVFQPRNPGDGRINSLKYLGDAPDNRKWVKLDGLALATSAKVDANGKIIGTISIKNIGKKPVKLFSQELGLTILTKRSNRQLTNRAFVSDGPSYALITRHSFEITGSKPRWQGEGIICNKPYSWNIGKENALPHDFILGAGMIKNIHVRFDLPHGEYDFLCGYGGGTHEGKGLSSNLTAFDINKDGKAEIVIIKGRK